MFQHIGRKLLLLRSCRDNASHPQQSLPGGMNRLFHNLAAGSAGRVAPAHEFVTLGADLYKGYCRLLSLF
jgi:hypothetical protein